MGQWVQGNQNVQIAGVVGSTIQITYGAGPGQRPTPTSRRAVNVIAVSPGDVSAERKRLATVVDEINRTVAPQLGLELNLWRWEADASPGLHRQGPQGLIDEEMDIERADVVVGIFSNRLGTPLATAESGTAHELRRAWDCWKTTGRPQVFLYFCERRARLKTTVQAAQLLALFEFREAIPPEQMHWEYDRMNAFERAVRQHLTGYLFKLVRPVYEIRNEKVAVTRVREEALE